MNKKISHFFLAAIMAIVALVPMFASSTFAQTSPDPAPRKVIVVNQFNRRIMLFSEVALRAQAAVGIDRVLFLLSAQTGIPVTVIQSEFQGFGINADRFIVAELFARTAGVPSAMVVDLVNNNQTFGQIALQFNLPFKLTNMRLTGFMNVLLDEINIARGAVVATPDQAIAQLTSAMDLINARITLFQNILGADAFNQLFVRRLSFETGLQTTVIVDMQNQMNTLTPAQFAAFLLLDNTLSAAVLESLNHGGITVVTPGGIFSYLNQSQIPASLFFNRITIFMRAMNNDSNNV